MHKQSISSREFNQDVGRAKRDAANGPVFITDRGRPAHVLLSITDYERLTKPKQSLADALAMPANIPWFDWEPERLPGVGVRPVDFS